MSCFKSKSNFKLFNEVLPNGKTLEVRQHIDFPHLMAHTMSSELGDCWTASMRLYMKLKGAGAIRVRGNRARDRTDVPDNPPYHYWVENKGMVFESSCGVRQIYKKTEYYDVFEVQDVQVANFGLMFDDEIPNGYEDFMEILSDNQLESLIDVFESKLKVAMNF
jgi:hypothetical protein